jgi:hypothetical protein
VTDVADKRGDHQRAKASIHQWHAWVILDLQASAAYDVLKHNPQALHLQALQQQQQQQHMKPQASIHQRHAWIVLDIQPSAAYDVLKHNAEALHLQALQQQQKHMTSQPAYTSGTPRSFLISRPVLPTMSSSTIPRPSTCKHCSSSSSST